MNLAPVEGTLYRSAVVCDSSQSWPNSYVPTRLLKRFLFSAGLTISFLVALPVEADEAPVTSAIIIEHTLTSIYQPQFAKFAEVTKQYVEVAQLHCANPSTSTIEQLRKGFESVVASFSAIEFYRIGALLEENHINRLFYWPDKRRVVERQLGALLAELTINTLSGKELSQKSVALQGLPALERLLFDKNAERRLSVSAETADCQLILAIAENMNTIAVTLNASWHADSLLVQSLLHPEQGSDYFRNEDEVLRSMVTQIIVGVDVVLNRKIAPLHSNKAGIKKAPLWRSRQSLSMIGNNLESLRALTVDSGLASTTNLDNELAFEFRTAGQLLHKLQELPALIDEHGDLTPDTQSLAKALAAVVKGVKDTLNDRFSQALGISAGFNSEDGD